MQGLRLSPKVVSVTLLQQNASGEVTPVVIFTGRKEQRRKTTRGLRILEKALEQVLEASEETVSSYRRRFRSSSRKKRDGWLLDMPGNVYKAVRDGTKIIRLEKIV